MTAQTRSVLKALFEDGDKPGGSDYVDWIDSMVSLSDTTAQSMTSDLALPKLIATTEVSSPLIATTKVSASTGNFSVIRVKGNVSASSLAVTGIVSASGANFNVLYANDVSASSLQVTGPARAGTTGAVGLMVLTQQTTIVASAGSQVVGTLPNGADVLDIKFFIKTAFATAGCTPTLKVGTSAVDTKYATFTNVTSLGMHSIGTLVSAGTSWGNVTGADAIVVAQVTVASGALASAAEGILSVLYVQK
jgi:hypothetical protein